MTFKLCVWFISQHEAWWSQVTYILFQWPGSDEGRTPSSTIPPCQQPPHSRQVTTLPMKADQAGSGNGYHSVLTTHPPPDVQRVTEFLGQTRKAGLLLPHTVEKPEPPGNRVIGAGCTTSQSRTVFRVGRLLWPTTRHSRSCTRWHMSSMEAGREKYPRQRPAQQWALSQQTLEGYFKPALLSHWNNQGKGTSLDSQNPAQMTRKASQMKTGLNSNLSWKESLLRSFMS